MAASRHQLQVVATWIHGLLTDKHYHIMRMTTEFHDVVTSIIHVYRNPNTNINQNEEFELEEIMQTLLNSHLRIVSAFEKKYISYIYNSLQQDISRSTGNTSTPIKLEPSDTDHDSKITASDHNNSETQMVNTDANHNESSHNVCDMKPQISLAHNALGSTYQGGEYQMDKNSSEVTLSDHEMHTRNNAANTPQQTEQNMRCHLTDNEHMIHVKRQKRKKRKSKPISRRRLRRDGEKTKRSVWTKREEKVLVKGYKKYRKYANVFSKICKDAKYNNVFVQNNVKG
eukprot:803945_1